MYYKNYATDNFMNILIIGSWGREHALAQAYSKNKKVEKVFILPGNGLMDFKNSKLVPVSDIDVHNINKVLDFVKKQKIDFADISPEDFLEAGYVEKLQEIGIRVFGPTRKAAQIEWSKDWSRNFMKKYKLPIPTYTSFSHSESAIAYIKSLPEQVFYIKASGLCGGKGAIRAENKKHAIEAIESMKQFGKSGETFLIEEALVGEEFSLFTICDGKTYVIAKAAQDHKTVFNADQGLNTGGMGCVSPTSVLNKKIFEEVEQKIVKPFLHGMQQEKRPYQGILYVGGMLTKRGVKIIEFNARWGSPEAEVIIPSIKGDYFNIAHAVTTQQLNNIRINFDNKVRVSVCGASRGYPGDYSVVKGKEIFGIKEAMRLPGITIFGAGIKREGKRFFASGGRIFHLVAEGHDIMQARKRAYEAMSMIYIEGNNLHYRTDIGWRDVERMRNPERSRRI